MSWHESEFSHLTAGAAELMTNCASARSGRAAGLFIHVPTDARSREFLVRVSGAIDEIMTDACRLMAQQQSF